MRKIHFSKLSKRAINLLKTIASFRIYSKEAPLHYEGQTPIVAYLIIKGNILLQKRNDILHKLSKGSIVGYREFCLNTPSMFTATVLKESEICYIDKSTIKEIKNSKNSEIRMLSKELEKIIL